MPKSASQIATDVHSTRTSGLRARNAPSPSTKFAVQRPIRECQRCGSRFVELPDELLGALRPARRERDEHDAERAARREADAGQQQVPVSPIQSAPMRIQTESTMPSSSRSANSVPAVTNGGIR